MVVRRLARRSLSVGRTPGAIFTKPEYLAQFFDTIEINTSFYQPLRPDYAEQWIGRVAANPQFQFTAKLWQRFTHEGGGNAEDERIVRAGFEPLVRAGKLAAVLMQFPFSFHNTPDNTAYLKTLIDRFGDYSLVVEVRHATWNDKEFFAMLRARGVGFCSIDQPVIGRSMKPTERTTSPIGYVRRNMGAAMTRGSVTIQHRRPRNATTISIQKRNSRRGPRA